MMKLAVATLLACAELACPCLAQRPATFTLPWVYPALGQDDVPEPAASCAAPRDPQPIFVLPPAPVMPPAPAPLPPAPAPVRSVIREYNWETSAREVASAKSYLLVLTDSTVRAAIAVWQQDGSLHFLAPDRTSGAVRLDAIDREATRRLNAERGLTLPLPQSTPSR
jgi:hypothetical protein